MSVTISVRQVKAARALLGWSQTDLASASAVSLPTIKRLEAEDGPAGSAMGGRPETVERIRRALMDGGVQFTGGDTPGVSLKRPRRVSLSEKLDSDGVL